MSMASLYLTRRLAPLAFVFVAVAFATGVTIQIFIAGLATFVNAVNWARHASFVNVLLPMPLLMLLLALVGRLPMSVKWRSAALLVLLLVQYFTAHISDVLPWVGAVHPVTATVLFWASVRIAANGWQLAFNPDLKSEPEQKMEQITVPTMTAETE